MVTMKLTVKPILMNALLILVKMVQLVQMESILIVACVLLAIQVPTVKQILMNAPLIHVKMEETVLMESMLILVLV